MEKKYQNIEGPSGTTSALEKEKARRKRSIWIVCLGSLVAECRLTAVSLAWRLLGHLVNRGPSSARRCRCHSLVFRHTQTQL